LLKQFYYLKSFVLYSLFVSSERGSNATTVIHYGSRKISKHCLPG
jgi:hypothetical protein